MEAVNGSALALAAQAVRTCDLVIDCGFEVGDLNRGNMEIMDMAAALGKPLFTLRENGPDVPGRQKPFLIRCLDTAHLLKALDIRFPGKWIRGRVEGDAVMSVGKPSRRTERELCFIAETSVHDVRR